MGPVLLGLTVAVIVLAVPFASRRLCPARSGRGAGPRAAPPVFPAGAAVPPPEVQPRGEMAGPFAYDNGVMTGERP